jgi:hypothetical protein
MFKNIWDSHSALSEESDIYTLTFVRWNCKEEFSPWNCILLTLAEAAAHLKIEDIDAVKINLIEFIFILSFFNRVIVNHFVKKFVISMRYLVVILINLLNL